jgi:hypothetical protein
MSLVTDLLAQAVDRMEIRTSIGPTISLDQPFAPSPPGDDSATTQFLRPVISIYPKSVAGVAVQPVVFAPYGDPGETKWPFVVAGLGLLLGGFLYLAFGRK